MERSRRGGCIIRGSRDEVHWHDKNLLTNGAAATITASPALRYLLSSVRGAGLGPLTHPTLIPSATMGAVMADIPLPVKYYRRSCLRTSVLSAGAQHVFCFTLGCRDSPAI